MIDIITKLRQRLIQFRNSEHYKKYQTSLCNDACVIDLVCCYAEMGVIKGRPLTNEEEHWFSGSRYIDQTFGQGTNSEWSDIADLYNELSKQVKAKNYFRR